ncbi:MAG: hypothetical protein HC886_15535 [Leptolyngbyaceae cyanobacterium SM1_1_3]|nr:hypothetical protein [Leptolyngbyaceae cyanobacterium SM1_1_3]
MKAIKATGNINEQGQIFLDRPLITDRNRRVEVIVLILEESEDDDEQSQAAILEDFRQAWQEAMTGQTISIAQLWQEIEDV